MHRPFVAHVVEEPPNVRVQNPVHPPPLDAHTQRVQRPMRTAPRTKPVAEAPKVHLVYLIQDGHHGLLNNFVLQRRDADRTLPSVRLRDVDPPRCLRPVRSPVNPVLQIGEPTFQTFLVLLPPNAVHSRRRALLQRVKTRPQQLDRQMVQQCGEPFLLPFPRYSAHTGQTQCHALPVLCRGRAALTDVLLGWRPSLPLLRRADALRLRLVRRVHWYYDAIRLLIAIRAGLATSVFSGRTAPVTGSQR